jgi:acetate---CoA ligase (ADP-forming)
MTVTIGTPSDVEKAAHEPNDARDLAALLAPRTIAVIGASRRPDTIGHQITANLIAHGFTGAVYPVNPSAMSVCAVRAYPTVEAIPDRIDLAVVVVPRQHVIDVATTCGAAGVRSLVVISAGFKEVGAEGARREQQLLDVTRSYGMRMVGPNCMGVVNAHPGVSMNATFAPAMPPFGHAAFVSQSGALGVSVLDYAREYGIGISQFVSVGNKADVSGNDLLLAWEHDPAVKVILMYVENFGNPTRFLEIATRITRTKPIIVVKSGRSLAGARAASSHTGALAASDVAVDALLAQAGVLRASSMEELFDMAMAFNVDRLPRSRRTAVITNAGGPGILAADALETNGLEVVELAPTTVDALRPLFPAEASIRNPLDMIASATPSGYRAALTAVLNDPRVDAVVPIFVPPFGVRQADVAEAIVEARKTCPDKPVLAVLMGRDGLPQGRAELHAASIPAYIFPESAARALAALNRHREWAARPNTTDAALVVDRQAAETIVTRATRDGRERLDELEALEMLSAYGIPVAQARRAQSADAAAAAATELGFPVAMKIMSADVVHKSDVGGVTLGLRDVASVRGAYDEIMASVQTRTPDARVQSVLIQRMLPPNGRELIVGTTRDRDFGALVMFGLGGIFVEALRDVVFRIAPLRCSDALDMLDGIRGARVLAGIRGGAPLDRASIADVLRRVSLLARDFPEIRELDVNPLMAYEDGVIACDARVRLDSANGPQIARRESPI